VPKAPTKKPKCCDRPAVIVGRLDAGVDVLAVNTLASDDAIPHATPAAIVIDLPATPVPLPSRLLHCVWRC
jgi:hypothetical protein